MSCFDQTGHLTEYWVVGKCTTQILTITIEHKDRGSVIVFHLSQILSFHEHCKCSHRTCKEIIWTHTAAKLKCAGRDRVDDNYLAET